MSHFRNFSAEFFTSFIIKLCDVDLACVALRSAYFDLVEHFFDLLILGKVEKDRTGIED
jgi:hypothetical protein